MKKNCMKATKKVCDSIQVCIKLNLVGMPDQTLLLSSTDNNAEYPHENSKEPFSVMRNFVAQQKHLRSMKHLMGLY